MFFAANNPGRRPATIGLRLMLWGTSVTLAICLIACLVLYVGIEFSLRAQVDVFLRGEIQEFLGNIRKHPGDYAAIQEYIHSELGSRTAHDLSFRLLDADGRLLIKSEPVDRLPHPWLRRDNIGLPGAPAFETISVAGARFPYRVCSVWITGDAGARYIAQAAYVLKQVSNSMAIFRRICLGTIALAGVLALLGGHYLARRSLLPLNEMTATAQRIGAQRLSERVPRTGNGDELDRLAETLNAMLDRIERHVRQIQQFTADASHELRNPLAALRGNAEVALTHERSADQLRRVIEDAIAQYDRLSRIAEDLLLLARLDAGESILSTDRLRLDAAVEDVLDLYTPLANDQQIEIAFAPREEIYIDADGARLRQLVGNLVDNAVKYSPPPGRVDVSLTRDNGAARLIVRDTGMGIPPEHLPRVFDRFYRVDRARSGRDAWGSGLGLAICRSIAEAHGGRIELASAPGRGTTVTVILPLAPRMATSFQSEPGRVGPAAPSGNA